MGWEKSVSTVKTYVSTRQIANKRRMADSVSDPTNESSDDEMDADKDESDDSSEDEKSEAAVEARISELEQQVIANPYNYDPHLELIKCLKKDGDLNKLREARERMSKIFPLTEDLWLDWIRDEINLASSDEDRQAVHNLFERAVVDYLSVDVWLEYAQYSIGSMGTKDGVEKCRDVFERAVTACGLHVAKASILWDAYREFELAMLSTLQHTGPEGEEQVAQQTSRVMNLFKRQLSIPLIDMEKTYEELKEWLQPDEKVNDNIETGYQKALQRLTKIQSFEDQLLLTEPPRTSAFQAYIDYELFEGDPARVQCVFERALVENCLVANIWTQYTNYLETQLKIDTVVLPVYERAVRNCPWHVDLWQGYIKAMERHQQPHEKIKELADRALGAGFTKGQEFLQLWLVYLDYLRRWTTGRQDGEEPDDRAVESLRKTFQQADDHLNEYFGRDGDPNCAIKQYWARIESRHFDNMEKARLLWTDIMQSGHGHTAQMWLQFAQLELCHGDDKHLRKLFARALQATTDWPELISEAWTSFERDNGSLEQFDIASMKIAARIKVIQERRNKEQESRLEAKEKSKSKAKKKMATELGPTVVKRKVQKNEKDGKVDTEGFKIPTLPQQTTAQTKRKIDGDESQSKRQKVEATQAEPLAPRDKTRDEFSVFLSNLDYNLDDKRMEGIFSEVGEIRVVRVVRDFKGRSKGFGYVEFKSKESVGQALKKDRELIDGRPMYVSKCIDKSKGPSEKKFKYTTGLEKCKLFVRGLPFATTKDDLETMFGEHGNLKEARLVTYKNGKSKGLAFVEFRDEVSAATALLKLDGHVIGTNTISVALSNPPDRKGQVSSLGGGPSRDSTPGPRGRGRTQLSLIPRALRRNQGPSENNDTVSNCKGENGGGDMAGSRSNEDFRSMLLGKD